MTNQRKIGAHDYVNPYSLLNFAETDGLPEANELFDRPSEWDEIVGSMTRRRRALNAELKLNDGSLVWLPELRVTDEAVHGVLSKLDDSGWSANDWSVFRMLLLNRFLMFGELNYFYSAEHTLVAEIASAATNHCEHSEFVEFISPYFGRRLAVAIKGSLSNGEYETTRTLFASNLPVTDSDLDDALEPLRRNFQSRLEKLGQINSTLENKTVTNLYADVQRADDEAKLLNSVPSHRVAKLREDMCLGYRGISIALANHRDDYKMADLALQAAEKFHVSELIKARLLEDRAAIEGLLKRVRDVEKAKIQFEKQQENAKIQSDRQHTLRLTLKKWFKERSLEITPLRFCWGEESISADKIDGIRFGIDSKGKNFMLAIRDINGNQISCDWLDQNNFKKAITSVTGLYMSSILNSMATTINNGKSVTIGSISASESGITVRTGETSRWGHPETQSVKWHHADSNVQAGFVVIKKQSYTQQHSVYSGMSYDDIFPDRFAAVMLSCRDIWNAVALPYLIEIMKPGSQNEENLKAKRAQQDQNDYMLEQMQKLTPGGRLY